MNTNMSEGEQEILDGRLIEELLASLPTEALKEMSELAEKDELTEEKIDEIIERAGVKKESIAKKVWEEFTAEKRGELPGEAESEEEE